MAGLDSSGTEAQRSGDLSSNRGGWITLPFMLVTMLGMSITSFGWGMNMIVFLIKEFNIKSITAAQISNIINGCVNILPLVAAILADSFFGNIPVISSSAFISLTGISLLTLIASLDSLRPRPCETGSILCKPPSKLQLGILYAALVLVSIGSGGTRFTLASAGANQYKKPKDQGSFFNWYFLALYAGAITSTTAIVYIQDNASWKLGFGLCTAANLISFIVFIAGTRYYKHDKPLGSPFTNLIRVLVAATVKRKAVISSKDKDYHHCELEKEAKITATMPSKRFRFLNRAALKTEEDLSPSGVSINKWRLCSVQEVEDFKVILRLLPLWAAILFLTTPVAVQMSLMVLQAMVMDTKLGTHFKVSAGSLQVIVVVSSCIFLVLNKWIIFPMYQKLIRKPLKPLQQVGIGHVFIILSMAMSAIVEAKRLKTTENGHTMSVLWLVPSLVLVGIGEAFYFPGNIAVIYGEFPESLRNTATSLPSLVIGICFYVSTALIDMIQRTTKWLPDDINHGRVDNVYWVLVIGGVLNFFYFLFCSLAYRYRNLNDDDHEQDHNDITT